MIKRKDLDRVRVRIREINPEAFYSIEDIRVANQGVFPKNSASSSTLDHIRNVFRTPRINNNLWLIVFRRHRVQVPF